MIRNRPLFANVMTEAMAFFKRLQPSFPQDFVFSSASFVLEFWIASNDEEQIFCLFVSGVHEPQREQ